MAVFTWHNGIVPEGMKVTQVYGLVFTKDGRLLLRVERKEGRIKYSLAGGKPEADDGGREGTLKREFLEEVNTTLLVILFDDKMQIYFNSPSIATNNTTKTPFKTKVYKLPHIIQNKPQPEMIDILVEFYV